MLDHFVLVLNAYKLNFHFCALVHFLLRHLYSTGVFDYCDQESLCALLSVAWQWQFKETSTPKTLGSQFSCEDAVIDHAVTLIGFGRDEMLLVWDHEMVGFAF